MEITSSGSDQWRKLQLEKDMDGLTPLHIAVIGEDLELVRAILTRSPFSDLDNHFGSASSNASADSIDPDVSNSNSWSIISCSFNFLHGRTKGEGLTAIHLAVVSGCDSLLEMLIAKYDSILLRAPPEFLWDFADHYWMTPLHYAVLWNRTAQIKKLVDWQNYSRHVNARDYFQRTPLHIAACHRPVAVEDLLSHPAIEVNAKDSLSLTPLHWAVLFGRTDVVQSLVELRSRSAITQVNDRDAEGRSVLEVAMESSLVDLIPAVSDNLPFEPFEHDKWYLKASTHTVHLHVSVEIQQLLLTCPNVSREAETLEKNLVTLVNAINAFLVVAALIASASFGLPFDDNGGDLWPWSKLRSFYLSVAAILGGIAVLMLLGTSSWSVGERVRYARTALTIMSWTLSISTFFFLFTFAARNALSKDDGFSWLVYVIVSAMGAVLCFVPMILFSNALFTTGLIVGVCASLGVLFSLFGGEGFTYVALGFVPIIIMVISNAVRRKRQFKVKLETMRNSYLISKVKWWDTDDEGKKHYDQIRKEIEKGSGLTLRKEMLLDKLMHLQNRFKAWQSPSADLRCNSPADEGHDPSTALSLMYWRRCESTLRLYPLAIAWQFSSMTRTIMRLEHAYRSSSVNCSSNIEKEVNKARHDKMFLDRLPNGILYWINYSPDRFLSRKAAGFYRGHIFARDFKIYEIVSKLCTARKSRIVESGIVGHSAMWSQGTIFTS